MNKIAIKVENLGKKYVIHHEKKNKNDNFRDLIVSNNKKIITSLNPFHKKSSDGEKSTEDFWALNDVNFEINKGDKVGIIGRNGAGKSTLLKVLSRITEPTTGKVNINGRIASLLEVGTGFHPELTGRENIYLNGAILGMSRKEIKSKFDEIVTFAEVDKFLDTPVKRYSSGMYVRLAFSIAAHLEPEILIVDEVLAVGDVAFQKKCLGKMNDVSGDGRTIIFVSHNMNAIEQLCNHVILLKNGQIYTMGKDVKNIINDYLSIEIKSTSEWRNIKLKSFNDIHFTPTRFAIENSKKEIVSHTSNNEDIYVIIEGVVNEYNESLQVGYTLFDSQDTLIYRSLTTDQAENTRIGFEIGDNKISSKIPKRLLNEGIYRVELDISVYCVKWICEPIKQSIQISFTIEGGLSDSSYWITKRPGILAPVLDWVKR